MTLIRERVAQAAAQLKVEVALFSSFTFNADFFEQNALPALFGCQPDEKQSIRDALVHKGLATTKVAVLYDASLLKPSKHRFRYTAVPIYQGTSRLFHPKNLILFGKDLHGERWIYVAAMSANLSISGWGHNCEGIADTWIHAKSEQPAKELRDYLQWLQVGKRSRSDVLAAALEAWDGLRAQRALNDPEGGAPELKQNLRLYFSPLHRSLWSFLKQEYGPLQSVVAGSPYWGDSSQAAKDLKDVELSLIAARCAPRFKTVNLGQNTLSQLYPGEKQMPELRAWHGDHGRFHHLKLYRIQTGKGQFTGLGSCNFTDRGQFWGQTQGNVESMLFDQHALALPETVALPRDSLSLESQSEDAPSALVAYVSVQYDWRESIFRFGLDGSDSVLPVTLHLPDDGEPVLLTTESRGGTRNGQLRDRTFTFTFHDGEMHEGLVEELNVEESSLVYGRTLPAQDILYSWQRRSAAEPAPLDEDAPAQEDEDGGSLDSSEALRSKRKDTAFDWFLFYRGVQDMCGRLGQASTTKEMLTELALTRSDSVVALCESVTAGSMPPAAKWLVTKECIKLLKPYEVDVPNLKSKLRRMRLEVKKLKVLVEADMAMTLPTRRARSKAADVLTWYDRQLTKVDLR